MTDFELETWIVEVGGDVVEKKSAHGWEFLTPRERLIYCVWVADYGMRNAGDLATAAGLYADFQKEAAAQAAGLGLNHTCSAFELAPAELQERYFDLLGSIVGELHRGNDAAGG